jgi:hypothetical protein
MSDAFFSAGAPFRDRKFIVSFAVAAALAIGGIGFAIDNIVNHKIKIDPIARAEFHSAPESGNVKSIADLIDAVRNRTASSTKDIWSGYAIDLGKLCAILVAPKRAKTVVLFKAAGGFTVGITDLDSRTCALAGRLKRNESIYAMSDTPDPTLASEKRFFTLDYKATESQ